MGMKTIFLAIAIFLSASISRGQNVGKKDTLKSTTVQMVNNTDLPVEVFVPVLTPKLITVEAVKSQMSKGLNSGFQVDIPEVTPDQIDKNLQSNIRNKTKSKVSKTNNEYFVQGTVLSSISDKPLDVYVVLTRLDSSTRAVYFFEQDSAFISEEIDVNKTNLSKEYVRSFATSQYKEQTQNRIKGEKEKLGVLEKDLKKLMTQNQEMHSDIKGLESSINNTNMDIKANQDAQEIKTKEIAKQKELVGSIKEKEAKKVAEKGLNDLNKENKKLREEYESLNKKTVKYRADIEAIKLKIKVNMEDQYLKNQALTKQRGYIRGIEAMAEKIR